MSFFNNANNYDASSKLPFFPAGFVGDVEVDVMKGITRRNGERAIVVEFVVKASNLADVHVGGKYSWFQSLKEEGTAYPACIAFLHAALGLSSAKDKAKIDKEIKPKNDLWLNAAINEDPKKGEEYRKALSFPTLPLTNCFKGAMVRLQTSSKKTKSNTDFTLHAFSPAAQAA